jgi:hypothetical protein
MSHDMSEHDVASALAGLRGAVRESVPVPPSAEVRARAEHQLRVRRTTTLLVAAAAVVAIVLGASAVIRPSAAPIQPGLPTPSAPTTTPSVRPSLSVPPYLATDINDPIADVDWANATIDVPANRDCPSGRLDFSGGKTAGWPRLTFGGSLEAFVAYGDLNGDSRPEAVLVGVCLLTSEDSGDGQGQLLVVTRSPGGTLLALDWVGPRGGLYNSFWVSDGRLFVDVYPQYGEFAYSLGSARAYRWQGGAFGEVTSDYPGLQPAGAEPRGPAIDLGPADGPVATTLGCPGGPIRLGTGELVAENNDVVYNFEQSAPGGGAQLVDLSGSGERHLLVTITCYDSSTSRDVAMVEGVGVRGHGLLVLQSTADGYRAVDFLPLPSGYRISALQVGGGRLTINTFSLASGVEGAVQTWVWNGSYFQLG